MSVSFGFKVPPAIAEKSTKTHSDRVIFAAPSAVP